MLMPAFQTGTLKSTPQGPIELAWTMRFMPTDGESFVLQAATVDQLTLGDVTLLQGESITLHDHRTNNPLTYPHTISSADQDSCLVNATVQATGGQALPAQSSSGVVRLNLEFVNAEPVGIQAGVEYIPATGRVIIRTAARSTSNRSLLVHAAAWMALPLFLTGWVAMFYEPTHVAVQAGWLRPSPATLKTLAVFLLGFFGFPAITSLPQLMTAGKLQGLLLFPELHMSPATYSALRSRFFERLAVAAWVVFVLFAVANASVRLPQPLQAFKDATWRDEQGVVAQARIRSIDVWRDRVFLGFEKSVPVRVGVVSPDWPALVGITSPVVLPVVLHLNIANADPSELEGCAAKEELEVSTDRLDAPCVVHFARAIKAFLRGEATAADDFVVTRADEHGLKLQASRRGMIQPDRLLTGLSKYIRTSAVQLDALLKSSEQGWPEDTGRMALGLEGTYLTDSLANIAITKLKEQLEIRPPSYHPRILAATAYIASIADENSMNAQKLDSLAAAVAERLRATRPGPLMQLALRSLLHLEARNPESVGETKNYGAAVDGLVHNKGNVGYEIYIRERLRARRLEPASDDPYLRARYEFAMNACGAARNASTFNRFLSEQQKKEESELNRIALDECASVPPARIPAGKAADARPRTAGE